MEHDKDEARVRVKKIEKSSTKYKTYMVQIETSIGMSGTTIYDFIIPLQKSREFTVSKTIDPTLYIADIYSNLTNIINGNLTELPKIYEADENKVNEVLGEAMVEVRVENLAKMSLFHHCAHFATSKFRYIWQYISNLSRSYQRNLYKC